MNRIQQMTTAGVLAAYPIAAFVLGREAAVFAFVIPFAVSSIGGAIVA